MNATDINNTYDLLGLAEGHTRLHKSGASYAGPCPFCGQGKDRFVIVNKPNGWRWYLRTCSHSDTGEKYHTPIDYVMHFYGLDFKEAARRMAQELGGNLDALPRGEARIKSAPLQPKIELNSDAWRKEAWDFVNKSIDRLWDKPEGQPGRAYLIGRGLDPSTWGSAWLGFAVAYNRPAIVIPYYDESRLGTKITCTLTGVKLRFIDNRASNPKHRYLAMKFSTDETSKFYLYGMFSNCHNADTLLLVEGDLNCLSIRQLRPDHTHVLSLGSQTITDMQKEILKVLALRYRRVILWMDEPATAQDIQTVMTRPDALLLQTVKADGVKFDANELLKRDLLAGVLTPIGLSFKQPGTEFELHAMMQKTA